MRSLFFLAVAASLLANGPARADDRRIAVTPSGNAEMMLADFDIVSAGATIAELCNRLNWDVKRRDPDRVTCGIPSDERVEVYLRRPAGIKDFFKGGTHMIVQKEVRFLLSAHGSDTYIQALAFKRKPDVDGIGFTDIALQTDNTFNGLINVLALTGATFVPGTSFPNLPWYGFDADEIYSDTIDGRSTAVIRVGPVEAAGIGATAGIRQGDLIVGIDDRRYRDSRNLLRRLALAREGTQITFDILRNGEPASHKVLVSSRPVLQR